jgi:hypothetical protein
LAALAAAFACVTVAAYLVINVLPFDSYSLAWDWRQVGVLCLYFLMAAAPFLLAGWVTGACLATAGPNLHRPYAANLVGAGLGSLGALLVLDHLTTEAAVFFAAALGSLAACCFAARPLPRLGAGLLSLLLFLLSWRLPPVLWLQLSPYKPLASARLAPMARTTVSLWSASTRLDAVEGGSVHVFPGLSLNATGSPPPQAAVFLDGKDTGLKTPNLFENLEPGRYRVALILEGYRTEQLELSVEAGQAERREVSLSESFGEALFDVRPTARVLLDGSPLIETPYVKPVRIRTGRHTLTLVNESLGVRKQLEIIVREGETLKIVEVLQ